MDWHAVRTPEANCSKKFTSVRMVQAIRSKKFIIRLNSSSYPFKKIHQPFEWFELSVRKNSSSVRMARTIHSRKFISHLNASSFPLEKFISRLNCLSYPFKEETVSYFGSRSNNTRQGHHVYVTQKVVTLLFFVYLRLMTLTSLFTGKRSIHKLLSNRKPYGPYLFIAAEVILGEKSFRSQINHSVDLSLTQRLKILVTCKQRVN